MVIRAYNKLWTNKLCKVHHLSSTNMLYHIVNTNEGLLLSFLTYKSIPVVCIHRLLRIFHRPRRRTSHALRRLICRLHSLFSPTSWRCPQQILLLLLNQSSAIPQLSDAAMVPIHLENPCLITRIPVLKKGRQIISCARQSFTISNKPFQETNHCCPVLDTEVAIPAGQTNPDVWRLLMTLTDFASSRNGPKPG